MCYFVGILGHASNSDGVLIGADGTFLKHVPNPAGMEWRDASYGSSATTTRHVLEQLARSHGIPFEDLVRKSDRILIAMSGLDNRASGTRFLNQLADSQINADSVHISSLAEANYMGAFHCRAGALLRCGHGSSAFVKVGDEPGKLIGGWGQLLGDHGSGFWLGKKALQAVVRVRDGGGGEGEEEFANKLIDRVFGKSQESEEQKLLKPFRRLEEVRNVMNDLGVRIFLTEVGKATVAIAEQGNGYATKLMEAAFAHLLELIDRPLSTSAKNDECLPICIRGSMVEESSYFRTGLLQFILGRAPYLQSPPDGKNGANSAIVGAGLLALKPCSSSQRNIDERQARFLTSVEAYEWSRPQPQFVDLPASFVTAASHSH